MDRTGGKLLGNSRDPFLRIAIAGMRDYPRAHPPPSITRDVPVTKLEASLAK